MNNEPIRPKENFLVFGAPYIEKDEIEEVVESMRSGWLGTGPRLHGLKQTCVPTLVQIMLLPSNSCTAALHLALIAAGIKKGNEVITTPMTFCATINAIIHAGGTPVLANIDPLTMNIDPVAVESRISPRTKAILPVHFAGRPCEIDALCGIAEKTIFCL